MAQTPSYDLLRRYDNDVDALAGAVTADPAVRAEVTNELSLLESNDNKHGVGSIIERCISSRIYAAKLRKALGDPV